MIYNDKFKNFRIYPTTLTSLEKELVGLLTIQEFLERDETQRVLINNCPVLLYTEKPDQMDIVLATGQTLAQLGQTYEQYLLGKYNFNVKFAQTQNVAELTQFYNTTSNRIFYHLWRSDTGWNDYCANMPNVNPLATSSLYDCLLDNERFVAELTYHSNLPSTMAVWQFNNFTNSFCSIYDDERYICKKDFKSSFVERTL